MIWPTAVLFCVRNPLEHTAAYRPHESYPTACLPGVLGPIREERCGECGALMYIAAVRLAASNKEPVT